MRRLWVWLNERWPLDRVLYWSLDEPIVGGASFWYTLGSATLIVFALQVVSGVWQLFYYVPTVDHAYDSLMYLRTQVYFGWLVHGLHYWGASLMVILVVVHMARVFVFGAYKNPRQLTWLSGVGLLLLTLALSLTGAPLPWDERGYWAGEVATSIAGTVPVVGSLAERLLRGGDTMGQLTLSRFFVIHVALLPGLLVALLGLHLLAFRQFGSTGPWSQERRQTSGPFWPDQVFKDAVVGLAVFLGLLFLSAFFPPPIAGPADPTDSTYLPKPEWNFLFLYEALKFFPGKLEPLGTVGLPLVGVLVLTGLPFFDRNPERDPSRRRLAMATGGLAAAAVVALTWAGLMSGQAATSGPPSEPAPAPGAGTTPLGSVAHMSSSARAGMQLFQSLGCVGCHQVNGVGGSVGPGLSGVTLQGKDRNWLMAQIRDPKAHFPNSVMPPFATLSQVQLDQLVDYLQSLSEPPGGPLARAASPAARPASPTMAPEEAASPGPGAPPQPGPSPTEAASPGPAASPQPGPSPREAASPGPAGPPEPGPSPTVLPGETTSPGPGASPGPAASGAAQAPLAPRRGTRTGPEVPPATTPGPPGPAADILGSAHHGAALYKVNCASCHGENAQGGLPNPGSQAGSVPSLNPISPALYSDDPQTFADNIDRILQHGALPAGPDPALHMPAFGDTNSLSQQEIADLEAYILGLNGVNRDQVVDPGLPPRRFFFGVLGAFALSALVLLIRGAWASTVPDPALAGARRNLEGMVQMEGPVIPAEPQVLGPLPEEPPGPPDKDEPTP